MTRKWLGKLMAIVICLAVVKPLMAWNDTDSETQLVFQGDDAVASKARALLKNGKSASGDLVIPAVYSYYGVSCTVVRIDDSAFWGNPDMLSATVPNSVSVIGENAFKWCSAMTNVVIGSGVSKIPARAFYECEALESITIGSSVKSIESEAFYGCSSLQEIVLPEGLTRIGENAFAGCTSLVRVVVPSTLKVIEHNAFGGCSALVEVSGSCNLESCALAFYGTPFAARDTGADFSFVKVGSCIVGYKGVIPRKVWNPGTDDEEEYVDELVISNDVTAIADAAFCEEEMLEDPLKLRYNFSFPSEHGAGRLVLPDSLKSVGAHAFQHCGWMKDVLGGTNVAFVGDAAFYGTMYSGQGYSDDCLYDYEGRNAQYYTFRQVILGQVLVAVKGAWPSVIAISNDVKRIASNVFYNDYNYSKACEYGRAYYDVHSRSSCYPDRPYTHRYETDTKGYIKELDRADTSTWMTDLGLPSSLEILDEDAFTSESVRNLAQFSGGGNLREINSETHPFACGNPYYDSLASKGGLLCLGNKVFGWFGDYPTSLEIPEGMEVIAENAFGLNEYSNDDCVLAHVTFPSTLKIIGKSAFRCQKVLEAPTIPEGVEVIGGKAFAYCANMHELILPSTLKRIGNAIVYNGAKISSVTNVVFLGNAPEMVDDDSTSNTYCPLAESQYDERFHVSVSEESTGWIVDNDVTKPECWPWRDDYAGWSVSCPSTWTFDEYDGYDWWYYWSFQPGRLTAVNKVKKAMVIPSECEYGEVGVIGSQVFGAQAATLEELTIPSSVKIIATDAFVGCSSLTLIHASASIRYELEDALAASSLDVDEITFVVIDEPGEDPIPPLPGDATSEDIAEALEGSADPLLTINITDITTYNNYRTWANGIDAQAVHDSPFAWQSFALDQSALLTTAITNESLKIESFLPSTSANETNRFVFSVSIKGVTIGENALKENLVKTFGLKGYNLLDLSKFSSDVIDIKFDDPEDGMLKFTAGPKDEDAASFFMQIKVVP